MVMRSDAARLVNAIECHFKSVKVKVDLCQPKVGFMTFVVLGNQPFKDVSAPTRLYVRYEISVEVPLSN